MEEKITTSNISVRMLFAASTLFLVMMCVFYIVEAKITIAEFGWVSFTSTGLFGILSMFTYSLYAAKMGRPNQSATQQASLAIILTALGVAVYVGLYILMVTLEQLVSYGYESSVLETFYMVS